MVDSEIKIRIKIIAGYLLVTLFTLVAGWWIYVNIFNIVTNDETEYGRIYDKSTLTSSVISYIYQVDYYGNRLTQSYSPKAMSEYRNALEMLNSAIDSLGSKLVSQHQCELVSELKTLIGQKNRNTLELTKISAIASRDNSYERSIDQVIESTANDSPEKVVIKSTIRNDTLRPQPPVKRTFFQRLGDAFAPRRVNQDSVVVVSSVNSDTLRTVESTSDSIVRALQRARDDISTNRSKIKQTLNSKLQSLVKTEQRISVQVSLIINELSHEATQSIIDDVQTKRNALKSAGQFIAIVAIVAILMIVLFLFFILKDISRSARYKRELEESRNHAEELMNSRHRMLLNISHDIKAPLCSITGYLDLMCDSEDQNVRKWAESMKISSSYIMDLLTNLLEYARLETGKSIIRTSAFNIDKMVDDVMLIFTPIAHDKGISIKCSSDKKIGFIASDAIRMRQIVMNLISNAVKFTDQGGVEISYRLDQGNMLTILVKDSGRGIDKSKLDTIFDEFTRDQNVEGSIEGSGLGLAVVRGAVVLLSGKISVESNPAQGSTFTVTIPVSRTDTADESSEHIVPSMTILAVDDDPLQLRMITEMISRGGHTLHTATKLKEVDRIVSTHRVDLVLTDLQMGVFSGYKLLQHIRSEGYQMPIVAVSASDHTDIDDLKKAGFDDFLHKPFTLPQLNSIIMNNGRESKPTSIDELMDGDQEAIDQIMELFATATAANVQLLTQYLNDNDMEQTRKLCHKMLPMFLQLGLTDIAKLLNEVDAGEFDATKIQQIITLVRSTVIQTE